MRLCSIVVLSAFLTGTAVSAAEPANMSGTWKLNVDRSKLHGRPAPSSLQIVIQHNEPKLSYKGRIYTPSAEGDSEFSFDGAIDGKEYPVKVDTTDQRITFKRLSPYSVQSDMHTVDGKIQETATTAISLDGKTLVRRIIRTTPQGKQTWTETYDKV